MAIYSGTPACMFEMNRPEFFSGPGSGLLAGGECPALPVTELDCGFLITSAIIQSDGSYHICVQANDQTLNQTWEVWNWGAPPVIASGTLPTMCFDLASSYGAGFTIIHTVFDQTGKNTCPIFILILADTLCQEGIVTANVENCNLETTINIDITNIGTPYVITFGDGSPAEQSSANQVTHTYGQPGSHEVCLTYHVPGTEGHITCCYSIEVALPPYCTCPENVVSVVSVEPCTWVAEMNFALNIENFPITVDYGDGTSPEVVTGPSATHDFPDNGTYNVCYTFEPMPGSTLECCELVNIPGCCLDASFTLIPDYANGWESCLNPTYLVTPTACLNNIVEVTHIWEFSDGTVFNVPFPSPHIFTNFVDANGQVCVTHTIICCDESVSETVCADHIPGAYLGEFGGTIELDDILPSTGETVLQFIYDNANGPLPFIVDGQLNANMNAYFTGGTWNMAKNSVVVVVGGTGKVRDFSLNGTILRSAVWLPGNPPCCRWQGVQSRDLTNISLTDAWIMDANYAIYYPGGGAGDSNFPALSSVNSHYVNNYYGIKSEGKFVNFVAFSGNEMKGTHIDPEPQVCDCDAVNAIDFREVNPLLTIKIDAPSNGTNTIYNYEKAFNFVNTKLFVRGFDIYSLQNFGDVPSPIPNNGPGLIDAAIGIDYAWGKTLKSSLDLDRITFSEFEGQDTRSVAVRDSIKKGKHTLKAIASDPYTSITTYNLAGGYELIVGSGGGMVGEIKENSIHTNGAYYGFGINGNMASANNTLSILANRFSIGSNTSTSLLNGGIMLASANEVAQKFTINDNVVDVLDPVGAGIGITNAFNSAVKRNMLTYPAAIPGILLREGGNDTVDCNTINYKAYNNGITVESSGQNRYAANNFLANANDIEFSLDVMSQNGTNIWWNSFSTSIAESIHYNANTITGQQHHTRYNKWYNQNGDEAVHATPGNAPQCQFWYPSGASVGTVNHPASSPSTLFFPTSQSPESLPLDYCEIDSESPPSDTLVNPGGEWAALVNDTSYWNGLTAAERTFMQQELYGLLLANSNWTDTSTVLAGFQVAKESDFVGQSAALKRDWQALLGDISAHQASLDPTRTALDSLSNLAELWIAAMDADTSLQDSLNGLLAIVFAEGDSLTNLLEQADSIFYLSVQDSVGALLTWNATLDEDSLYTWYEKRYNEIALNWLAGTEPDSAATADLRQMAQTCLRYGGRAVLGARGLCEVLLKEYYDEDNCDGDIQTRSAEGTAPAEMKAKQTLYIVPNPADDLVRIFLPDNLAEWQQVRVFNLSGQQVYAANVPSGTGELSVSVGNWPEGLYIVRVANSGETSSQGFVVQHRR